MHILCVYKEYEKFDKEITFNSKNGKGEKIIWRWITYESMVEVMPLKDVSR